MVYHAVMVNISGFVRTITTFEGLELHGSEHPEALLAWIYL